MSTTEYTFFNYPKQYTLQDYQDAIKKIVELHKYTEEITSLYRFGSISALGISDIDFFVVTKNNLNNFKYRFPVEKLNSKENYILMHSAGAVLSEDILPKIQHITPLFELECLYSKDGSNNEKQKIRRITQEEASMFLSDVLFMLYPHVFIKILTESKINVRNALNSLFSLRYSIDLFGILNIKKQKWSKYIEQITILRKDWFNIEAKEREKTLLLRLNQAISISMEIIEEFDTYRKKKYPPITSEDINKPTYFIARNQVVLFKDKYNKDNALKEMFSFYKKNKLFLTILPMSIAEQLIEYSFSKTAWGDYIAMHMNKKAIKMQTNNYLSEAKMNRCVAMSQLLEYSLKVGYRNGAFTPFNLGYLNYVPFINQIREELWKIWHIKRLKRVSAI